MENKEQGLRNVSMNAFNKIFDEIINALHNLPLHPNLKSHCFMNLDQGAYWARQAISIMEIVPKSEPVVEEVKNEELVESKAE